MHEMAVKLILRQDKDKEFSNYVLLLNPIFEDVWFMVKKNQNFLPQ